MTVLRLQTSLITWGPSSPTSARGTAEREEITVYSTSSLFEVRHAAPGRRGISERVYGAERVGKLRVYDSMPTRGEIRLTLVPTIM